jgi:hypothetical protein
VTFTCSPSEKGANTWVQFGLSEHQLLGSVDDGDVTFHIDQLCKFTEQCYRQWQTYLDEQRNSLPELNYYTTEQLVILCTEMAKLSTPEDVVEACVLPILQSVKPDCSDDDIKRAMQLTQHDLARMEEEANTKLKGQTNETDTENTIEEEELDGVATIAEKEQFFKVLRTEYRFAEDVVQKAWDAVGPNIDEGDC